MRILKEDFQIHDKLDPKLFDDMGKLLPEVRSKLVEIVKYFEQDIPIPIEICDIQICGSRASYNYIDSEEYKSDIDCHIIANFEQVSQDTALLQAIYDSKKSQFNSNHDITIHGVPVELYVQDIKSTVVSNGIYSVCDDSWVKQPKPLNRVNKPDTSKELEKWSNKINSVIKSENIDLIRETIDTIYLIRHNSIAADGEQGKGNILYKDIRSNGLLDKLKEKYNNLIDKQLTLEELSQGQIVNRV